MSNRKESRRTTETRWRSLSEVFAVEVTTAVGRCRSCSTLSQVATFRVGHDPSSWGAVHCGDVLLRLVRTPDAVWVDFGGVSALRIPCESTLLRTRAAKPV